VSGTFSTSYDNAITSIAGLLSTINVHNNYQVTNSTTATLLPTGSTIPVISKPTNSSGTYRIPGV
jgi:hypothetical protein